MALLGVFGNALSLGVRGGLAGCDAAESAARVVGAMPGVLLNELRVWLPYNLLLFSLVPPAIRPTSTAVLGLCWQAYLSYVAHDGLQPHAGAAHAG